ncbi:MAG: bifunctional folylpolyglutamate synthase/dihydrofolate synthase [Synergistaceae bacterium]|jgi:dihydrofolate synthase/folylpolyglutamate synthase|nr:bifunctional folylpolyglutamate synthase/dihydrofolate synthase [Synergistaceae bacterium]
MRFLDGLDNFGEFEMLTGEMTGFSSAGIRPGQERISRLLALLGNPHEDIRSIQVLGTNGKGSTSAALEAIFLAGGMKAALYTSPHLVSLQERLRIGGRHLSAGDWRAAWERVRGAVLRDRGLGSDRPSFFEHFTAVCLVMMKEAAVDIAVIEAGMGGRYDATTACRSGAALINPIGMDHMQYLGPTLEAIAMEKFAAVRNGADAFYAGDDESLIPLFLGACETAGAVPHILDSIARPSDIECTLEGTVFSYEADGGEIGETGRYGIKRLFTPLIGAHQAYNAARAVTALLVLKNKLPCLSFINPETIRRGLAGIDWPGRMEAVIRHGRPIVILDGAHNEHAMRALVSSLSCLSAASGQIAVGAVVFAAMRDKGISEMLGALEKLKAPMYCAELPMDRSASASDIAGMAARSQIAVKGVYPDPWEALEEASLDVGHSGAVLCCGSLFLVGHLRRILKYGR